MTDYLGCESCADENSMWAVRDGVWNVGTTPGAKSEARVEDKMSKM